MRRGPPIFGTLLAVSAFSQAQADLKAAFDDVEKERARLLSILSTLYVNAVRASPEGHAALVSFVALFGSDLISGTPIEAAAKSFEKMQKCARCRAASPILIHGRCEPCATLTSEQAA